MGVCYFTLEISVILSKQRRGVAYSQNLFLKKGIIKKMLPWLCSYLNRLCFLCNIKWNGDSVIWFIQFIHGTKNQDKKNIL